MRPERTICVTVSSVKDRAMLRFAWAGLVAGALLIVWPLRLEQALWAVTVGHGPTRYVPVRGGKLVTPLRMLVDGLPREAASLRSAVRAQANWADRNGLRFGGGTG